jgi:glycosyltransferase involved in cell wall biosynthesis
LNKPTLNNKRIAILYQYKYPESRGGGERRLFEVFKRFESQIDWYIQNAEKGLKEHNIHYIPLSNRKYNYRSLIETFIWPFLTLKIPFGKYDIIHIGQMPFFHLFFLSFKLSLYKILRIRRPIIIIDWWEYWGIYWKKFTFPMSFIGFLIEKYILLYYENFIVISEKGKRDIEKISKGNIALIYNGINLKLIEGIKTKKSANFIYFGRLEDHKRVDRSIEVFSELIKLNPKYTFQIIGDGSCKEQLELLVRKKNLTNRIFFTGRLDDDHEMYALIKGADCMLFFGTQEGGGSITLLEANACGIPVAHSYSNNGIDRDQLTDQNSFFYNNYDIVRIAKDLHSYVNNSERKKSMKKSCVDFVKDKDWSNISNNYKSYFKKI